MPKQSGPASELDLGNRREERAAREVGSSAGFKHSFEGPGTGAARELRERIP
jgi:hypothetical protein